MHIAVDTYTQLHTYKYTLMHVCTHIHTNTYTCTHTYKHSYMCTYTHTYIHTLMHVRAYTHMQLYYITNPLISFLQKYTKKERGVMCTGSVVAMAALGYYSYS